MHQGKSIRSVISLPRPTAEKDSYGFVALNRLGRLAYVSCHIHRATTTHIDIARLASEIF